MQVLWEDHRNDLFINGFGENRVDLPAISKICLPSIGLFTSAGGSKLVWCMSFLNAVHPLSDAAS